MNELGIPGTALSAMDGIKRNPDFDRWRTNKVTKHVWRAGWRAAMTVVTLMDGPEFTNRTTGLFQDSLLDPQLWYPSQEGSHLGYKEASPGEWIGYDFRRPTELRWGRKSGNQLLEGKMFVLDADELKDRASDEITPTGSISVHKFNDLLSLDTLTPQEMLENGYLGLTNYNEAFAKAGLSGQYGKPLSEIGERTIYEVTPKGNSIVFLIKPPGSMQEASKKANQRARLFDLFASPSPLPE